MLLNALFAGDGMREEALAELKDMDAVGRLATRRIFQAAFAMESSGSPVTFHEVHARLEEADQNLLADAVLQEEVELSPEAVRAALVSMRRSGERHDREQLKARIKESERAGNWEEALRLTAELEARNRAVRRV
jgi:hypothetical protein